MALGFLVVAAIVTGCLPRVSSVIYVPYIMEDACDGLPRTVQLPPTGPGSAIIMRSHQGAHYKSGLTCNFIVKTSNDYRIVVVFETIQFPGTTGNCSDSLLLSNAEQVDGPICTADVKEVVSRGNVMNVTWSTGGGEPPSNNDGFEAIVTAYKPGTTFCTFSQFKCANHRCVADNFACDGHNNCGDNSDEKCDFGTSFWRSFGSMSVMMIAILVMGVCMVMPLVARACFGSPEAQQQQPACIVQQADGTYRVVNANAVPPTPYPGMGPAPEASQQQPQAMGQFTGTTGIPVNLETGRLMRFQAPPEDLANVDYPRTAVNPVNPIVMSLPETSVPSLPDAFGESQPAFTSVRPHQHPAPPSGFADLQQPFRAANAQMPQRQRTPLFQHSHPPLSLYDQPDPMRPFPVFGMGGGPFGPVPFGGGPITLGGPMGMPFGGPMGAFPPRMPALIIIETGDDDDSQFQEPVHLHGGLLPSSTSSSNQEAVFPTLLLQQRQQEMQRQRAAEEEEHRPAARRRPKHRHGTGGAAANLSPPTGGTESQGGNEESKEDNNEAKRQQRHAGKASPRVPPATGAIAQPAPPPKTANKKDTQKDAVGEAEKTVMRIDRIETLASAAAALQKMGLLGRPISAPSGNDCIGPDAMVIRRAKSQWDAPLDSNHEQNKIIYDLPSISTYEYASVWSNTSSTYSETTMTTTETDGSRGTQLQTTGDDSDVNYLRPTVSLENITVLDKAQQRDKELRERRAAKKRE
ncbi:uncharacterized protein [Dermacentor albipictus]|uniref:uncharacterized protein n=1 Tax=Dermacentor albipictus TaxID=60249 RepID=UPI0038FC6DEB